MDDAEENEPRSHSVKVTIDSEADVVDAEEEAVDEDSALVVVDWYMCSFRPTPDEDGDPDSSQEKVLASHRLMEHFALSLRGRFRVSVILFGSIYGFSHLCILALEFALNLTPNREGMDWHVYGLRTATVLLCLAVVVSPQFRFWVKPMPCGWNYFRVLVLLKSLTLCALQLMQKEPSYGYIVFNQAFIYTFLPMHPLPTACIAFVTLALYCFVGMYFLNLHERNPLIAVGLGFLQALAHARRYNWMLQGHLQMCNIKNQKRLLAKEEQDCDNLLHSMLPASILHKLQQGLDVAPERFDDVTVLFAEICDFSSITQHSTARDVVVILNMVFSALDSITDKWGVHKVETVCQVYMAVAGCPERSCDHAAMAANTSLDILDCVKNIGQNGTVNALTSDDLEDDSERWQRERVMTILNGRELQIHIGLNSGAIRAGVIGIRNTRFKLFGDTVNTASRMESTCERQRVQVSAATAGLLRVAEGWRFELEHRGEIHCKGKGKMQTYYLLSSVKEPQPKNSCCIPLPDDEVQVLPMPHLPLSAAPESEESHSEIRQGVPEPPSVTKMSSMDIELERATASLAVAVQKTVPREEQHRRRKNKLSLCWLNLRRLMLRATTDTLVDLDTLAALDVDDVEYSRGCYQKWLKALQGKGILVILLLACLDWMDYWRYLARGWDGATHLSVTLRNGVIVPLCVSLLCISSMPEYFRASMSYVIMAVIAGIGTLVIHSAYTVYVGDSGYFLSFLLLFLDVTAIPLRWRVGFSFIMIIFFSCLMFAVPQAGDMHSTMPFLICIYVCFCLSVHGQEHFTHLSDFKHRALQRQNMKLKKVQDMKWQLLTDFLPPGIARRILEGSNSNIIAESYEDVTILFTDMKGFTAFSSKLDPAELARFLNSMFSAFDEILQRFGLFKVEVIGDAYFVVSGAPETEENRNFSAAEHAAFAAEAALAMVNVLGNICEDSSVCIRVGLHSGSVVGGVVGRKDPRFHLFGNTVELANRMEEYSEPNRVHLSSDTHRHLTDIASRWRQQGDEIFSFEDRGFIEISSAPQPVHTYFLNRSTFGRHFRMQQRRQQRKQATDAGRCANASGMGMQLGHLQESMRLGALHHQEELHLGSDVHMIPRMPSDPNFLRGSAMPLIAGKPAHLS
eukprot:TRINITY_DN33189_c0_g1_i1.p1 TRINITY_DN33189_c0_g1~~TRINITY_DN33189_c0_g1_i1.p1  ORF type:complete len:1137 (+),score=193.16 TRINITY_DN33189_c0_g1_i1:55-3465(+)